MPLVTVVDSGKGQHCCLDSWGRGRSDFLGLDGAQRDLQGEEGCARRFVFSKGSDYVIYSHRLAQLQESDPLRRSFSLSVVCGLSVPVDGRRVWGCGFLLWSWWKREARQHGSRGNFVYYLWAPVLFSHGSLRPWKMAVIHYIEDFSWKYFLNIDSIQL